MADYQKYKLPACGAMLNHYQRDRFEPRDRANKNIDTSRTHENYTLGRGEGMERIRERIELVQASSGRAVRKDAVVMGDWCITAPPDVRREDLRGFFESCYRFVCDRYGEENVLGGYVHMDETSPHIHIPITPVVERDGGRLAFSSKDLVDRADLRSFHPDLSDRVTDRLGYRPQILLDPELKIERSLSKVGSLDEFKAAADRLERLRRDGRELEEERSRLERRVRGLESERSRLEEKNSRLEVTRSELDSRVEWLSGRVARVKDRLSTLREFVGQLRERTHRLEARVSDFVSRLDGRKDLGDMRQWEPSLDYPRSPDEGHDLER